VLAHRAGFFAFMKLSKSDRDSIKYSRRIGEWSINFELKFDKHLEKLVESKKGGSFEPLYYGLIRNVSKHKAAKI